MKELYVVAAIIKKDNKKQIKTGGYDERRVYR